MPEMPTSTTVPIMDAATLKRLCQKHDLYNTPELNDTLYLHFQGFREIKNLSAYSGLRVLWIEGNMISKIENLEAQAVLQTLYLNDNC